VSFVTFVGFVRKIVIGEDSATVNAVD